jgi:putative ABC transport system permease protein
VLGYYLQLALRSLRQNVALTLLTVILVGAGVGCFTFAFTTLRVMSSDPIPQKSSALFAPRIYSVRPDKPNPPGWLPDSLVYRDAMELMHGQPGIRQSAIFSMQVEIAPKDHPHFTAAGKAVNADFFPMFEVPFHAGSAWTRAEDKSAANVVVLSAGLANRLFPEGNPMDKDILVHGHAFRIVGVLGAWNPLPRFYDVWQAFSAPEDLYIPLSTARANEIDDGEDSSGCLSPTLGTTKANHYSALLNSDCFHTVLWVELPTKSAAADYRSFLLTYIRQQQHLGRFLGTPRIVLQNVRELLVWAHVVPNEALLRTYLAIGFLFICLVNAAGLILAQLSRRPTELSVRRAMGASRLSICWQILTESVLIGCLGGLLGVGLAAVALALERSALSRSAGDAVLSRLTHMDSGVVLAAFAAGAATAIIAALFPAWQVSKIPPARHLKLQ